MVSLYIVPRFSNSRVEFVYLTNAHTHTQTKENKTTFTIAKKHINEKRQLYRKL